jgi:hypothetical protein
MKFLKETFDELLGLFVDDLSLVLAVFAWLGLAAILLPFLQPSPTRPVLLFLGLAGILVENVLRSSKH